MLLLNASSEPRPVRDVIEHRAVAAERLTGQGERCAEPIRSRTRSFEYGR
jgi:hypothetical protein